MSDKLDTTLVLNALNMALHQRRPAPGLIIHTDRGCQYASEAYRTALAKAGAIPSMSRRANCYDNAAMESAWSTLKLERVYPESYATHDQARARSSRPRRTHPRWSCTRWCRPAALTRSWWWCTSGRAGRGRPTALRVASGPAAESGWSWPPTRR